MVVDWKSPYRQNDYTTQGNIQISMQFYQITKNILHRISTKYFQLCMETQETLNSQTNIEEKQNWRNQAT